MYIDHAACLDTQLLREEAEKLAAELGVYTGVLRRYAKKAEGEMESAGAPLTLRGTETSEEGMGVAGSSTTHGSSVHTQVNYLQAKQRGNIIVDMVKNLPVLVDTEPGNVFTFLLKAKEIFDLNLVVDVIFFWPSWSLKRLGGSPKLLPTTCVRLLLGDRFVLRYWRPSFHHKFGNNFYLSLF
jgi:hypothetical protein